MPVFLLAATVLALWHHVVVVITTAQLYSTKSELRFGASSNPAHGVLKICNGEDLCQWSWLEIRLNAFRRSTTPWKPFIIIKLYGEPRKGLKRLLGIFGFFFVFWLVARKLLEIFYTIIALEAGGVNQKSYLEIFKSYKMFGCFI